MRKTLGLAVVAACGLMGCAKEPRFVFVEDGQAKCALVASKGVQRSDLDFFTNAVFRCTGASLPIVEGVGGRCRCTIEFSVEDRSVLTEDAYEVAFPDAKTMRIRGSGLSVRWALNRILEDAFGVCFCLPGPRGTHYPAKKSVSLAAKGWKDDAAYRLERDECGMVDPEWKQCLNAKYKTRIEMSGHMLRTIFPEQKFNKEPWISKLLPQINGKRERAKYWPARWQPCFACKEGVDEAVAFALEYLRQRPGLKWFSLGVNDSGGHCECDGCKAMNGGSVTAKGRIDRNFPSFSNAYARWMNAIAERVCKVHPDVMIGFLAYREVLDAPDVKLHPNLVPFFCIETFQRVDEENERRFNQLFDEWKDKCSQVGIYDYVEPYVVPRLFNRLLQKSLQLKFTKYPQLNGYIFERGNPWGEGPQSYLEFKLTWNPNLDLDRVLDAWCRACGGDEAAPYLREFYDLWEEYWREGKYKESRWWKATCHMVYLWFQWPDWCYTIEPDRLERAGKLVDLALAAAERSGSEDQKARMRELAMFQRRGLLKAWSSGVGAVSNPYGKITTDADITLFEQTFPRMQASELEYRTCFDHCADLFKEDIKGVVDTPKWRANLIANNMKFNRYYWSQNRYRLINAYLAHRNGAADPEGRNFIAADAMLEAADASVERVGRGWKVTATGPCPSVSVVGLPDPDNLDFFLSATVRNETVHPISFEVEAGTVFKRAKIVTDKSTLGGTAEPGKQATVNVFICLYQNSGTDVPSPRGTVRFSKLRPGESVILEELSFRHPSVRALRVDDANKSSGMSVKEDNNMTTLEEQTQL